MVMLSELVGWYRLTNPAKCRVCDGLTNWASVLTGIVMHPYHVLMNPHEGGMNG